MDIKIFENIVEMMLFFNFKEQGIILEKDIHEGKNYEDRFDRNFHDAEVLTTIAKNTPGDCFEIGTSSGHGAYKLATNTSGTVFTLNALPEQIEGNLITHKMDKNTIGSFLRQEKINNYIQIYENSILFNIPKSMNNIGIGFIDGCHDTKFVYLDSKKLYPSINKNGFIIWHDFSPMYYSDTKTSWVKNSMNGVIKFCDEEKINTVFHLKNSLMGFYKKE